MSTARSTGASAATLGIWLGIVSAATSSISGPMARSLTDAGWTPAALTIARALGAGALMLVPAVIMMRGQWELARRESGRILLLGGVGVAGTSVCYYNAITLLPISVALLIQYSAPVLVLGYTSVRRRRVPHRTTLAGVALAMVGLVLVVGVGGSGETNGTGLVWAACGSVCFATYFVASEAVSPDLPAVAVTAAALLVAGVTVVAVCLTGVIDATATTRAVELASWSMSWIWPLALLVVVATVITYTASLVSVSILGARVSSFVLLSELAFAVLTAWALAGETPRWMQLVGGAVLVGGIVLVRLGDAEAHHTGLLEPDPVE